MAWLKSIMRWLNSKALFQFLCFIYSSFMRNRGLEKAKSLTYTTLFAVVPFITLVFAILSAFPSFQVFGSQIQEMIFDRLLPSSSSELESYLSSFADQAKNLTWVGGLMLLVTAFLMLVNVERNFNQIWGVKNQRKGLSSFLLYWSVLSLGPLLLGVGFAVSSYVTSLVLFEIFSDVSASVGASSLILSFFPTLLTAGAFTLIYVAVPNCGVRLKDGIVGGAVVALSFILVKNIFTRFISTASYELVYGTFAVIPIFLLWIYVSWVLILLGANLVRCIPIFTVNKAEQEAHSYIVVLALLHDFWFKQQSGQSVKLKTLMSKASPFQNTQIEELLDFLVQENIVRSCSSAEYSLIRDLQSISLWELFNNMPDAMPKVPELAMFPSELEQYVPDYDSLKSRFCQVERMTKEEFPESLSDFFRHSDEVYNVEN